MHAVLLTAGEAFLALLPVVEPFNGTAHFLGLTSRHLSLPGGDLASWLASWTNLPGIVIAALAI